MPTTNTFLSLRANQLPDWEFWFNTIIDRFSAGVYNPYWGHYGAYIFHGGGHASTYDNSVLMLDLNDLTYKRLSDASPPSTFTDSHDDPLFDRVTGEYGDGQPGSGHSFDILAILPPEDGGAAAGSLIRVNGHGVHVRISRSTGWAHRFDLDPAVARGSWVRASTNTPTTHMNPGGASAYDPRRKRVWWIASLSGLPPFIRYLDIDAREQRQVNFAPGAQTAPPANPDSMSMRYDPVRDLLLLTVTWQGNLRIAYLRCDSPAAGWFEPSLSMQIPTMAEWAHPMDHVPELDRWLMLSPADKRAVYEITIPSNPNTVWNVQRRAFTGLPEIPTKYVAGKLWSYSPRLKAFVWLSGATSELHAYRPVGV